MSETSNISNRDKIHLVERLRAIVSEQAEDEALWAIYPFGEQPIAEAYLQQELRRLHAAVESVFEVENTP